jgi:molybdopterin-guanine dinucleotide biosynthesis protein A
MMDMNPKTTGIILAGGLGKRFGGINKALIQLFDKPLIELVIDALRPQVDEILISANRNIVELSSFGYPVIEDNLKNSGPLGGIGSLINHVTTDLVIVTTCDTIHMPKDFVTELETSRKKNNADIAIAKTGMGIQRLNFSTTKETLAGVRDFLTTGNLTVAQWQNEINACEVHFNSTGKRLPLYNINTPDDLAAIITATEA